MPMQTPNEIINEKNSQTLWSRSANHAGIRDMSHWLGEGRWNETLWNAEGEAVFALYEKLCCIAGCGPAKESVLEWGPGGGCNLVRFIGESEKIYGVDISLANLKECSKQLINHGYNDFKGLHIEVTEPEAVLNYIPTPVDFFFSMAVFQHFPNKLYGQRVVRIASQVLKPGGMALIQIRYDNGNPIFKPKLVDYQNNFVTFTSYAIDEFWKIIQKSGLVPLAVELKPRTNYAWYFVKK